MGYTATLNKQGGKGGSSSFAFDPSEDKAYSDLSLGTEITSISVPTRSGYAFTGYFNKASGGTAYIDADGTLRQIVYEREWNKDINLYAQWVRTCYVLTLDDGYGKGGPGKIYYKIDGGGWYRDADLTIPISVGDTLAQPRRNGYKSAGYYDYTSGSRDESTRITNQAGTVISELSSLVLSEDKTYSAYWGRVYTVTLDDGSGDGGPGKIYYCRFTGAKWCSDAYCDNPISSLADMPELKYFSTLGYYSESSDGTKYVNADGSKTSNFPSSIDDDATWYAIYSRLSYRISIMDGRTRVKNLYTSPSGGHFYKGWKLTQEVESLADIGLPTKECFEFYGAWTGSDGHSGTKYIYSSGNFSDGENGFKSRTFSGHISLYIQWTRKSYKIVLDSKGGSGGTVALYSRGIGEELLYLDSDCRDSTDAITNPDKAGYGFAGYYKNSDGSGTNYVSGSGSLTSDLRRLTITSDMTIYAKWSPQHYILTFDANGGTPASQQRQVTMDAAIGNLPTVTNPYGVFLSWKLNGKSITSGTVWKTPSNATAVANWRLYWGGLTDWFGLAGNTLMLVSSESGTGRQVTNLWNGATDSGPDLLNPVCTYRVKKAGYVWINLGTAFVNAFSVGYMITDFEYKTGADQEPTLTVRGVANEGANAINLYNVCLYVDPDHIAQDPFNARSGGGELVEMTSGAKCDPVVPYENNMPCASDVVHGRLFVSGRTNAYFGESVPTIVNSFIDSGVPSSESDVDFTTYAFKAEKSI